jgi:hypothetical protein
MTSRIDRLVGDVAERLGRRSRREFLTEAGAGAVALTGAQWAFGAGSADAHLAAGCWGTANVQVCYTPWLVRTAESGQNGIVVRKGPSFKAPPVLTASGALSVVAVGHHFGRQSKRISSPCGNDPGPRAQETGWLWTSGKATRPDGTVESSARSGWVPFSVDGVTYATGDAGWGGRTCGPCCDFDCRYPGGADPGAPGCPNYNGCNSGSAGPITETHHYWDIVNASEPAASDSEPFTLRYAANSVPIYWLLPGDVVYRHGYKKIYESGGPSGPGYYTWSCVEVVCAKWAPRGCGGWVRSSSLTNPRGSASGCSPSTAMTCLN